MNTTATASLHTSEDLLNMPDNGCRKVADWLAAGTRMVVVVSSVQHTVNVHHSPTAVTILRPGDHLDGGDVVPGWQLAVADLLV